MDSRVIAAIVGGAAAVVTGAVILSSDAPVEAVAVAAVTVPKYCHSYEEQKSDACRAFWSAQVDAGAP